MNAHLHSVLANILSLHYERRGIIEPYMVLTVQFLLKEWVSQNLVPRGVEPSHPARSQTRSNKRHFRNKSRQASSPHFFVQCSVRTSWNAENNCSTLRNVYKAFLYFRMFVFKQFKALQHSPQNRKFSEHKRIHRLCSSGIEVSHKPFS